MLDGLLKRFKGKAKSNQTALNATSAADDEGGFRPGDVILDRYEVENVFAGAMGKVYIAEHLGWKVKMAIKAPRPEVLADKEGVNRILTEANSWVRMGMHPNVATCYYALNIEDVPYLFIEYVDGGDLASWLKTGRCHDPRTALSMAIQFCHGMEFTHSRGIIHRDIKPANILLTKNALLKITDFGIIQTKKEQVKDSSPLRQGLSDDTVGFRGTPSYASPEQFRNTHGVDKRSDIFSFGICLWLMFCGRRPYKNNAIGGTAEPTPVDNNTKYPKAFNLLLKKAVAFNPADRFNTFSELRHALNKIHIIMFKVACPYMKLDFTDLQAENFNNRAVSLFELGKIDEGEKCIHKALDINDTLAEAVFNYTLFKWKKGLNPEQILRQLDASRQRLPDDKMLQTLNQAVKCDVLSSVWDEPEANSSKKSTKKHYPEYLLCLPKSSVDVFQNSHILDSAKANITAHLKQSNYDECHRLLFEVWRNHGFHKDRVLTTIYEQLLTKGAKNSLANTIRLKTFRHNIQAKQLICLPSGKKIFIVGNDGKLYVLDFSSKNKIHALGKYQKVITATMSPDCTYLAIGHKTNKVDILSLKSAKTVNTIFHSAPVTSLAFSIDSKYVAVGGEDGIIKTTSTKKDAGEETILTASKSGAVRAILYFDKGYDLISGSENGAIYFWTAGETECLRIVNAHAMPTSMLALAANGIWFISGAADRQIKIWDRQSGQCMKSIEAHEDVITAVTVLSHTKYFATAGKDDIIKIWDSSTGTCNQFLDGRSYGITALAHGPSSHNFLSAGKDGSITIWMTIYELDFH